MCSDEKIIGDVLVEVQLWLVDERVIIVMLAVGRVPMVPTPVPLPKPYEV